MLERVVEPELMLDKVQAEQYAAADFESSHSKYPVDFVRLYPEVDITGTILDIGCGPADVTLRFAKLFLEASILGLDGSSEMLQLARDRADSDLSSEHASRIEFRQAYIPLAETDIKADLIICNGTLHHFHNPDDFWNTVKLCSKNGTIVFVTDLLRPDSEDEIKQLLKTNCANQHHVHVADYTNSLRAAFTPREIQQQLEQAGLGSKLHIETSGNERITVHGVL